MFDMTQQNSLFYMYSDHAKHAWRLGINVEITMCFRSLATVTRDDSGRWLSGINSVYPRVPPLDVMSSLRASVPGGG